MSAATKAKAERLLAEGRVEPDREPARVFRVEGDSGTYATVISAHVRLCTCEHGRHGAGDCSHVEAAVEWILAEAASNAMSPRARARFGGYEEALWARRKRDAAAAEDAFRRLG